MIDVALSTMWGIGKFNSLGEFFDSARALGFTRFELNHGVDSAMLRGLDLNGYRITGVHEPCPADLSVPTLRKRNWLISAPDEENRRQGVGAVRRSIDLARELGAPIVIVHPGQVDIDRALDVRLRELYRQGKSNTSEYAQVQAEFIAARAAQAERNLQSVHRSLIELIEYAARFGIRLGLENRYYYHEIPLPDELACLLELGDAQVVGFWYDVGHAQTLDQLGFGAHEEWLRRFAKRIIGVHLHDVVGVDDHRVPGSGQVDWKMVLRHLPADAFRTCEFQNFNSPQEVAAGVKWLIEKGCVKSS